MAIKIFSIRLGEIQIKSVRLFFLMFISFFWESERERHHEWEWGRERGRENPKKALHTAWSLMRGLIS